jgi:Ca2+-binding EF-hand superfamily protein
MPSNVRALFLIANAAAALAAQSLAAQGTRPAAPPAQTAPDLSRAQFIATMDAQFRAQDPNNDGKLTRAEIEASERAKTLAAAQAQNRAIFAQLDLDHNGALSPAEFAGLVQNPPLPDVAPIMNRLDANRDQVVTLVEYRAATLANFDRLDTDHDGIVTGAEMRAGGIAPTGR